MVDKPLLGLKSSGVKMKEEVIICNLLLTLPKSFDPVVTAMKIGDLNIEFVVAFWTVTSRGTSTASVTMTPKL